MNIVAKRESIIFIKRWPMSVSVKEYKKRILKDLDKVPDSSIKSVLDYVEYLVDKEAWDETREIMADKRIMRQLAQADKDWNHGNPKPGTYVEWRKIRRDV